MLQTWLENLNTIVQIVLHYLIVVLHPEYYIEGGDVLKRYVGYLIKGLSPLIFLMGN